MPSTTQARRRPPSAAVYRRRRLMVGGTVVLLTIAFVDIVRGDDEPDARPTVQQVVGTPTEQPTRQVVIGPLKAG